MYRYCKCIEERFTVARYPIALMIRVGAMKARARNDPGRVYASTICGIIVRLAINGAAAYDTSVAQVKPGP